MSDTGAARRPTFREPEIRHVMPFYSAAALFRQGTRFISNFFYNRHFSVDFSNLFSSVP